MSNKRSHCKISLHMKQLIDWEAKKNKKRKCVVCRNILKSFIDVYVINGCDPEYIKFLNYNYLKYMQNKYNGTHITQSDIFVIMNEYYDDYIAIKKDLPNNHRLFELACFYYFNILPEELRPTYK